MKQCSATSPIRMMEVDDVKSSNGVKEIPLTLSTEQNSTDYNKSGISKHSTFVLKMKKEYAYWIYYKG